MDFVKHACGMILFESSVKIESRFGLRPDLSIKCSRCSRKDHDTVLATFQFILPRWIVPSETKPIRCQNPGCYTRICDLSLPFTIAIGNWEGDIAIKCRKCRNKTRLIIGGLAHTVSPPPRRGIDDKPNLTYNYSRLRG